MDWASFWLGVAASLVATGVAAVLSTLVRPRVRVEAGYTDPAFSGVTISVTNRSLLPVRLDEMGLLVDGKRAPLTQREWSPDAENHVYKVTRLRPLQTTAFEAPPREVERRAALVLKHNFLTGIDLRGYAEVSGRTYLAETTFTW